jgi:hypothetical protein
MKTYHVVLAYEVKANNASEALDYIQYPERLLFNIQVEEQIEDKEPEDGNAS